MMNQKKIEMVATVIAGVVGMSAWYDSCKTCASIKDDDGTSVAIRKATAKLQKKLYEDLNAPKDKVLVLPPDCTYDIVNDYNRRNMVVIRECGAEESKNE